MRLMSWILLGSLVALTACGPSEQKKAEMAEKRRIECLDKLCEGDVEPKRNWATEVVFKLNGQWYVMPKEYGNPHFGAMSFYWPSKVAGGDARAIAQAGEVVRSEAGNVKNFYEVAVETFLRGRHRWPNPQVEKPWEGRGWEGRFEELQQQGLRMERAQLRPDLERVRFFDAEGKQYRHEYFLATQQKKMRGNGVPGIACDLYPDSRSHALPRCNGDMFWQEDVYADFRFHSKHAADWPAIYQEIVRVLNLAQKVQP